MLQAVKRWLAILTTLGAIAVTVWLVATVQAPPDQATERRAAAAPLPLPDLPAVAPSAVPEVRPATAPAPTTPELCGLGRLPVRAPASGATGDAFDDLPDPVGRLALQALQAQLQRRLAAGTARERAAGWLLRQPDDPAEQAAWAAGLLAEARTGGDVQALRWATAACGLAEDAARCRKALARARVQAEPDNGLHWLEWAQEASSDEERAQAWQGLVRAQGWHEHPGGLTAVTQAALASLQPVPPAYLRARLARETLGRDASEVPEGQDWLESQCIRDRAGCAQVADRMSTEADSTALLLLAAALGRHVGWAQDRLDTLAATTQAFHARLPNWAEGPQAVLSCDAAERQLAHVEAVAKQGEVPRPRTGSRP